MSMFRCMNAYGYVLIKYQVCFIKIYVAPNDSYLWRIIVLKHKVKAYHMLLVYRHSIFFPLVGVFWFFFFWVFCGGGREGWG